MKPQIVYLVIEDVDGAQEVVSVYAEYETAKATADKWSKEDGVVKYTVSAREVRVTRS